MISLELASWWKAVIQEFLCWQAAKKEPRLRFQNMVWNDAKDPYRLSKHAQPIYMPNLANRWNESWSKLLCGGANASKPSRIPDRLVAEPEFQVVREPSRNDLRALGILQGFDLKLSSHLVEIFISKAQSLMLLHDQVDLENFPKFLQGCGTSVLSGLPKLKSKSGLAEV